MSKIRTRAVLGAALAAAMSSYAPAAWAQPQGSPVNLEGVWKLAAPTTTLKPIEGGSIPFTAKGRQFYEDNKRYRAKGRYDDYDIATSRCSSPGTPRLMITPMRFKIWQRSSAVTFDFEWNRAIRQIDMSGEPVQPALVPNMTGTSVGHWEGDALVAVTTDVSDRTLIDDLVPHSIDMKVIERIRLIDPDTLENRITIEDPEYFTKTWTAVVTYKRQPNAFFPEDVCLDRLAAKKPAFPKQ